MEIAENLMDQEMVRNKKKKGRSLLVFSILFSLLTPILVFFTFHVSAVHVDSYFVNSENVRVIKESRYYFFDSPTTERALLFYPGGKIDDRAYAPLLRKIAEAGIDVYCFHMPFYLPVFDIDRADIVLSCSQYSQVVIGGHSLGGAMAAEYLYHTTKTIHGLALFAAYSAENLSNRTDLSVFSTYGTKDQILNRKNYSRFKSNLGSHLTEVIIENGNHSGVGSYGNVLENQIGVISPVEQWNQMSDAFIRWMDTIKIGSPD